jgi:PKD repeat protein
MTARDAQGMTGTATRTITVTAAAPVNQAPVARFTWSCTGLAARQCNLNGSTSTDDAAVVSYTWDFGNGKSETHVGSSSNNTWAAAGTYNVTLTVKDASGLTNAIMQTITVP